MKGWKRSIFADGRYSKREDYFGLMRVKMVTCVQSRTKMAFSKSVHFDEHSDGNGGVSSHIVKSASTAFNWWNGGLP